MINSSSERQKSRRNEKRGQRKEISLRSRKVNPLRSVQTPTRYGSIASPIRENNLDSNWTPIQNDKKTSLSLWQYESIAVSNVSEPIRPIHQERQDELNCSTQRRSPNRNTNEVKRIYTKKERMIISMGGVYGVPFHLGLIPYVILPPHTTQTHQQNTMHARELQDYNWNTSTTHSIAYCLLLMKQGACPIPMTLGKTTAQTYSECNNFVSCVLNLYLLEYCINIDYQYFTLTFALLT